jgi:hypothetical protein
MAGNYQAPPRVKNALDNNKLSLSVKCPGDDSKWSNLVWGLYANNPRITVYTGDPKDTGESNGYGKISGNVDVPNFFMLIHGIREMIKVPVTAPVDERKFRLECKNFIFPGGKRSEQPVVVSEIYVGKDDNGLLWISVASTTKGRPRIKFPFLPQSRFHRYVHGDGSEFPIAKVSEWCAAAYADILTELMPTMLADNYEAPKPKDNGGGRPNNYNGGRSSGGGNNSQDDIGGDTDLPF